MALIAGLFGIITIKSGGQVLFGDDSSRIAAGDYVAFVLWFNFIAGFAYIIAGIGIALRQQWSVWIALCIAIPTLFVFALLGWHIFTDGAYELRTVAAMTLRSTVWTVVFALSYRYLYNVKNEERRIS